MNPKKPCPRVIRPSKYERNDTSNITWWRETCRKLEEKCNKPPQEKAEAVARMFRDEALLQQRLFSILSFPKEEQQQTVEPEPKPSRETVTFGGFKTSLSSSIVSLPESHGTDDDKKLFADIMATSKGRLLKQEKMRSKVQIEEGNQQGDGKKVKEIRPGDDNPYLNFFKRPDERAAVWHPLPPVSLEEMNLAQKGEAMTESIAKDFVAWMTYMSDNEKQALDVAAVKKMFEVGFNMHAATSLKVRIKEMPAVPQQVAEKRNLPQCSRRARLHRELKHDIKASKRPEKKLGFGTVLPRRLRYTPPKVDAVEKWLGCRRIKKQLVTMSAVWDGITNLRSTKGFCKWLLDHPEMPAPNYLRGKGMLDSRILYKIESSDFLDLEDTMEPHESLLQPDKLVKEEEPVQTQQEDEISEEMSDTDVSSVRITF